MESQGAFRSGNEIGKIQMVLILIVGTIGLSKKKKKCTLLTRNIVGKQRERIRLLMKTKIPATSSK